MTPRKGTTMRAITSPRGSGRFGAACCVALAGLSAAAAWAQAPAIDRLALAVDDHRPLGLLADELEKRYQVVITYEEAPWAAAADLEDVTEAIIRSNGPGKAAPAVPIIGPRKAAVSFEYALDPTKGRPTDFDDLLTKL